MARISVILVNYFSADLVIRAVHSVMQQGMDCEVFVVDNSQDEAEAGRLRDGLPPVARLQVNEVNNGFGAACNQAYRSASGEAILLLNPDAYLLEGALGLLEQSLFSSQAVGAVAPRVFWDRDRCFLMPQSTLPSPARHALDLAARRFPLVRRWRRSHDQRAARRYWRATQPLSVSALSGGHVLLKREALERSGGVFDERFFLYWEDSDLMMRLRQSGYLLNLVPQAHAVHEYTHNPGKSRHIEAGWQAFYLKHLASHGWVRWLERGAASGSGQTLPCARWDEGMRQPNGDCAFPVPAAWHAGWWLEVGLCDDFYPSIGQRGEGPQALFARHLQQRLSGQPLYVRLSPESSLTAAKVWLIRLGEGA